MAYHRYYGLDIKLIRIFNTYGPRMRSDDGRVLPNLIMQALKNEPLTIFRDAYRPGAFVMSPTSWTAYENGPVRGAWPRQYRQSRGNYHNGSSRQSKKDYRLQKRNNIISCCLRMIPDQTSRYN